MDKNESEEDTRVDKRKQRIKRWGKMIGAEFDPNEMLDAVNESDSFRQFLENPYEDPPGNLEDRMAFISDMLDFASETDDYSLLMLDLYIWSTSVTEMFGQQFSGMGERQRFEPLFKVISELSDDQFKYAFGDVWGFRSEETGFSVSQSMFYLVDELLDGENRINIESQSDAQLGIDIYRKCMDICDSGIHNLLSIKRASTGDDPREVDLESMNFGAKLNEIKEYPYSNVADGIDKDLRDGISHGDMIIDGIASQVKIAKQETYTYEDFEESINTGIAVAEFVSHIDVFLICNLFNREVEWGTDLSEIAFESEK